MTVKIEYRVIEDYNLVDVYKNGEYDESILFTSKQNLVDFVKEMTEDYIFHSISCKVKVTISKGESDEIWQRTVVI